MVTKSYPSSSQKDVKLMEMLLALGGCSSHRQSLSSPYKVDLADPSERMPVATWNIWQRHFPVQGKTPRLQMLS
eukprot:59848-Hanusia_phi.AAC.4